ncbi:MAG: addiction module protein [Xanthobacteraceae bacterium]
MTKLLEQAIAQVRQLPDEAQDAAAEALFAHVAHHDRPYRLSDEQVEEVKRRQQVLREGTTQLATDEEVAAVWKRCGG